MSTCHFRDFARILLVAAVAACYSPKPDADSTAMLPPPDTVKASTMDSQLLADSVRRSDSLAAVAAATKAKSTSTATKTETTTSKRTPTDISKENPNIGRDSVIRRPRRLPVDSPRSP